MQKTVQKNLLAIAVTTVVIYIWGFAFWVFSPLPSYSLQETANANDAAAQAALVRHFPESGAYIIPGYYNDQATMTALYEKGPIASLYIRHGGFSQFDPVVMIMGFVLTLVVVALLAGFFRIAKATEFQDYVRLSLIAGAVAVIMTHVGDMVWWSSPVEWKIWPLIYDYSFWIIAGHLLGYFMKKKTAVAVGQ